MRGSIQERFEASYTMPLGTTCWLWKRSVDSYGYGHLWADNRIRTAHRIAYELHVGPIPEGLSVLHRCDTPACVNPAHLFLGTQTDNMHDASIKKRLTAGHKKTHCKHGHEYLTGSYHTRKNGHRSCYACARVYDKNRRH